MPNPLILKFDVDDKGSVKVDKIEKNLKDMQSGLDKTVKKGNFFVSALHRMGSAVQRFKRTVFSLKGAIVGLAGALVLRSFMKAANTMEQLNVRMKVLLGSVEEGGRLMQFLRQYASEVPFEFEEIVEGAVRLSSVMKGGVDEIKAWIPLVGDLAAAFGMTMTESAEQMSRVYSAGIGAAELWRDTGVKSFLGFKAGATYQMDETMKMIVKSYTEANSRFRGSTEELKDTWAGMMSMMKDLWFNFRVMIMDAGVWDAMKSGLNSVYQGTSKWVEKNKDLIQQKVQSAVDKVTRAVKWLVDTTALLLEPGEFGAKLKITTGIMNDQFEIVFVKVKFGIKRMWEELKQDITASPQGKLSRFVKGALAPFSGYKIPSMIPDLMQTSEQKKQLEFIRKMEREQNNEIKRIQDRTKARIKELDVIREGVKLSNQQKASSEGYVLGILVGGEEGREDKIKNLEEQLAKRLALMAKEAEEKAAKDRIAAARKMYESIRMEAMTEYERLNEWHIKAQKALGEDIFKTQAEKEKALYELKLVYAKRLAIVEKEKKSPLETGTPFQRFKEGFVTSFKEMNSEYDEATDTWIENNKHFEESGERTFRNLSDAFSNTFVAGFTGETHRMRDIWKAMIAEMISEWMKLAMMKGIASMLLSFGKMAAPAPAPSDAGVTEFLDQNPVSPPPSISSPGKLGAPQNVEITINALDARSVAQLLTEQRGLITGLLKDDMNRGGSTRDIMRRRI